MLLTVYIVTVNAIDIVLLQPWVASLGILKVMRVTFFDVTFVNSDISFFHIESILMNPGESISTGNPIWIEFDRLYIENISMKNKANLIYVS